MTEQQEDLQSLVASAADIQRWALLIALKGSASLDRVSDIQNAANRIQRLANRLRQTDGDD